MLLGTMKDRVEPPLMENIAGLGSQFFLSRKIKASAHLELKNNYLIFILLLTSPQDRNTTFFNGSCGCSSSPRIQAIIIKRS